MGVVAGPVFRDAAIFSMRDVTKTGGANRMACEKTRKGYRNLCAPKTLWTNLKPF